jgi:tRNA (cytidine56-2'-O)-methyltransferase
MQDDPEVRVLRLGHRPGRDERMTTHVGLTARALGADGVVFAGDADGPHETVREITERFGGPFAAERVPSGRRYLREFEGPVVHLTMYGLPLPELEGEIRAARRDAPLLVVVGAGKVPGEVYGRADWNLAVTNQPHSEVAALAVFLDHLFEGRELDRTFAGGERRVVPQERGKRVVDANEGVVDAGHRVDDGAGEAPDAGEGGTDAGDGVGGAGEGDASAGGSTGSTAGAESASDDGSVGSAERASGDRSNG